MDKVPKNIFKHTEKPYVMAHYKDIIPTVLEKQNNDLKKDIIKNGLKKPLLVRKSDKLILFGNERYVIFKNMGIDIYPVRFVD